MRILHEKSVHRNISRYVPDGGRARPVLSPPIADFFREVSAVAGRSNKYWTSIDDVPVDTSLKAEDGWKLALRWLIDENRLGSKFGSVGYAVVPPGGGRHELHVHDNCEEVSIYLKGHGIRMVGDEEYEVGPMDIGFSPVGVPHGIRNLSDTEPIELICVYMGATSVNKTGYHQIKK